MRRLKWTVYIGQRPVLGFESESTVDPDDQPVQAFGFVGSDAIGWTLADVEDDED
jgi:hypothetical protein